MFGERKIRLFWFSEVQLMGKQLENYGDLIGKYLVEKIAKKKIIFSNPKKFSFHDFLNPIYFTAGSILAHVNSKCIVWGSGIIERKEIVESAHFLATRGPQTRNRLMELGYKVPELYGDPALLLPEYYNPILEKKYEIGIIAHYNDFKLVKNLYKNNKTIKVIDLMTLDVESKTDEILACKRIISSSLHGIIVAHAYNIPAIWIQFSNKLFGDGIKFQDYFESVGIKPYKSKLECQSYKLEELIKYFDQYQNLPLQSRITELQKGLMGVCPFK
jgi:hypothetical protein